MAQTDKQILIIDDDPQFRKMLRIMLEDDGYPISVAEDGEDGLRVFDAAPADLVITDILMPNKEGYETMMALKQRAPHLRIIAVTGGNPTMSLSNMLETAEALGADRVLAKPFTRSEILQVINELLA